MIATLTNHLWQSTLFVIAAAIVAFALRKNGAHVRHRVWLVASLKFLVPFSLLMSLGSVLPAVSAGVASTPLSPASDLSVTVDRLVQPFSNDAFFASPPATTARPTVNMTAVIVSATWASGFIAVVIVRLRGWRRIREAVKASTPAEFANDRFYADLTGFAKATPVGRSLARRPKVRATYGILEPGVVGLWRPVLLMPAGIEQHLTRAQLEAVLAHELCHIQRRDNLTSAIHMVVEALFWFHPLVWFVGARLVDERERACDEHVLRVCGEPQTYAESILSVCKLYVESPIACVSGVSGADLKKRVAAIIGNRIGLQLNFARKVGLGLAAVLAVALPLVAGMIMSPLSASAFAASQNAAASAGRAQKITPKFEVVSIKLCPGLDVVRPPGSGRGANPRAPQISPGYVHWDCVALTELIAQAYSGADSPLLNTLADGVPSREDAPKRVRGGPSWTESDRFTIEAKMSGDVSDLTGAARFIQVRDAINPALRAMLEDRFELKWHKATEQQSMYAISVAPGGLKVQPMAAGDCWDYSPGRGRGTPGLDSGKMCGGVHGGFPEHIAAQVKSGGADIQALLAASSTSNRFEFFGMSMPALASNLSMIMDRFVLDKTGLEGKFTFAIEFAADDTTPGAGQNRAGGGGTSIFKAFDAVGLRLEPTKGPSEYLQIDSVKRPRPN